MTTARQQKNITKQYIKLAIYRLNKQAEQLDATQADEWLALQQQMLELQEQLASI